MNRSVRFWYVSKSKNLFCFPFHDHLIQLIREWNEKITLNSNFILRLTVITLIPKSLFHRQINQHHLIDWKIQLLNKITIQFKELSHQCQCLSIVRSYWNKFPGFDTIQCMAYIIKCALIYSFQTDLLTGKLFGITLMNKSVIEKYTDETWFLPLPMVSVYHMIINGGTRHYFMNNSTVIQLSGMKCLPRSCSLQRERERKTQKITELQFAITWRYQISKVTSRQRMVTTNLHHSKHTKSLDTWIKENGEKKRQRGLNKWQCLEQLGERN